MPPKSGKKSPKLTKAEKERLKKEEAERKAKEEEDARLQAEEEERQRQEKEKQEKEERERIEAEAKQTRDAELQELSSILEGNQATLESKNTNRREKAKWDRYMRCDGTPDPTIQGEINTYINLWRENKEQNHVDLVLEESKQTLALLAELWFLLGDTPEEDLEEDLEEALRRQYRETVLELQDVLAFKLNEATLILLKNASQYADSETNNLQMVKRNDDITLMLWGNLSKNPRFKSFEFEEEKFTFELPKQLALSDVAVRIIHTQYDHFSHQCRSYLPKKKRKPSVPPEHLASSQEEKVEGEDGAGDGEENAAAGEEAGDGEGDAAAAVPGEEQAAAAPPETTPEEANEKEGEGDNAEGEEGEAKETPASETGKGDEPAVEEEEEEEDDDVINLRNNQLMGGIFYFDLFDLPPQPKVVQNWIMTQLKGDKLTRYPYPDQSAPKLDATIAGTMTMGMTLDPKAVASASAVIDALGAHPLGISMRLPESVVYSEEPQVAYWSDGGKEWRIDGFAEIKYDEAERTLGFKTVRFGPLALLQDKYLNMPFQSWELRPKGLNHALLTIIAAAIEVEIEIKGDRCCVRQAPDSDHRSEMESFSNKWMGVQDLMKTLYAAGINLFPEEDAHKFVSINDKDSTCESSMYHMMALTASHYAFSWSKWNADCGKDKIVVQGTEIAELPKDEIWSLLMISQERSMKLRIAEDDDTFLEDYCEGTNFHADLYHMVCELSSPEGMERSRSSGLDFVNTVHTLLASTKVITYS